MTSRSDRRRTSLDVTSASVSLSAARRRCQRCREKGLKGSNYLPQNLSFFLLWNTLGDSNVFFMKRRIDQYGRMGFRNHT